MSDCSDVEARLDQFVDSELSPTEQIDVARHLAGCPACDAVVERLLALRSGLAAMADAAVRSMPLAAVWPAVAAQAEAHDRRLWWRRGGRPIRIAVPMWAAGVAMAAGALLVLRAVQPSADVQQQANARRFTTPAVIERVVGNVDVRHDLKSGAPIILVNHSSEATAP